MSEVQRWLVSLLTAAVLAAIVWRASTPGVIFKMFVKIGQVNARLATDGQADRGSYEKANENSGEEIQETFYEDRKKGPR